MSKLLEKLCNEASDCNECKAREWCSIVTRNFEKLIKEEK